MKISDAPVASKAGKTQHNARVSCAKYMFFFCLFCGGFEYERIVTVTHFVQLST